MSQFLSGGKQKLKQQQKMQTLKKWYAMLAGLYFTLEVSHRFI